MNILVVGDAPNLPTGLGRIARDICKLGTAYGHQVAQLGLGYNGEPMGWPVFPIQDRKNWAASDIGRAWKWAFGSEGGAILTVWDPVRCYSIARKKRPMDIELWGYFAVDGTQFGGSLGLVAADCLKRYDRVLGYGAWGAEVLSGIINREVSWLPHLLGDEFRLAEVGDRVLAEGKERTKVGAVGTNQPRKHWPTVFEVFHFIHMIEPDMKFWIHTDELADSAWVFAELAAAYGVNKKGLLEITTGEVEDEELAQRYNECLFTVAPGLGEGFGYPIVESLGCGAPVVAYAYAGGEELVPRQDWLIQPELYQERDAYLIQRPVATRREILRATQAALKDSREEGTQVYCEGAVRHLRWDVLAPRWEKWLAGR